MNHDYKYSLLDTEYIWRDACDEDVATTNNNDSTPSKPLLNLIFDWHRIYSSFFFGLFPVLCI